MMELPAPRPPIEQIIAGLEAEMRPSLPTRLRRWGLLLAVIALTGWCLYAFNASPARIWTGLARLGSVLGFMFPPHVWTTWQEWSAILQGLGETVAMAFMGTLLGAVAAVPLALVGARNILPVHWLRLLARRGFDAMRAVETIILALVFIRAFGLGPIAGVLAIAVSDLGTFAKLFAEAIENTSQRPVEAVKSVGAGPLVTIRYGLVPQVLPIILSIILYNFESNVRSSTILGIVGAGGIGFLLSDRIRAFHWPEAWSIIILIIVTVTLIDWVSGRLRGRLS